MRFALAPALVLTLSTLGGCNLYFGGDDGPPVCGGSSWADDAGPPLLPGSGALRDPQTGACQNVGNPGGGGCYRDECGNEYCGDDIDVAIPDWAACTSSCTNLDETACLSAPGCEASYYEAGYGEDLVGDDTGTGNEFGGCSQTAPSGPVQGGNCYALDAQQCSRHDDCAMVYAQGFEQASFIQCVPEPTENGCSAVTCGSGSHCEQNCLPGDPTNPGSSCTPMCVPDAGTGCEATDCGAGYECVEQCDTMEPTAGGCFPGQCYPTCVPTTACGALPDEAACATRGDCTSVYTGTDCECYPGGYCDCETLTWDRCETLGVTPLPL